MGRKCLEDEGGEPCDDRRGSRCGVQDVCSFLPDSSISLLLSLGSVPYSFYTYLPGKPPLNPNPRSFIILPQPNTQYAPYFVQAHNSLALDEVAAHTGMFQGTSNDGYYDLGLQTAQAVREAVVSCRGSTLTKATAGEN